MNKPQHLAAASFGRFGLATALVAGVAFAAQPTVSTNDVQKMEKFVVTGSLIPIAAGSPAIPVTVIGAPEIEKTGVSTDLLDVLKKAQPAFFGSNNIGSENGNISSGSTNGGSQVSLRNRATLVLINGRRANISPVLASGGASFVDVSVIPISAVERIEILSDGASATYGSDAVSGVVNVILKTNYAGSEIGGTYGWSPNDGKWATRSYYGVAGATFGPTSLTITTEWKRSDPLIQKERDFAKGQFRTPSFAGSINLAGTTDFYFLAGNRNAPPQNLDLTPAQAVAQGIYQGPLTQDQVAQNFDLANYPTMLLRAQRRSFTAALEHKLNPSTSLFADFIYSLNETESVLNAQPVSGNVVGTNPNNPFNVTVTARNRFVNFPRIYANQSTSIRGVTGIKGKITDKWSYELAGNFNRTDHAYRNRNLIDGVKYTELVNSGAYNPFAIRQNPGVIESMVGIQFRNYDSQLNSFDLRINGSVFRLPAGDVQLGIGAETRWESLSFVNDRFDQTGQWLQATPRQPFAARQTTDGFFTEVRVPIFGGGNSMPGFHVLELSAAARHDIYSKTSDPTVPKYSLRWLPFNDELAIRGSYSESFTAPTLYDLFGPVSVGFTSSINITRYNTSGTSLGVASGSRQYRSQSGSNSGLNPSESRNWSAGVVWSPKAIKGLSVSADWFNIDERDLISSISSTLIVTDVEQKGPASPYAGLVRLGTSLAGETYFGTGAAITSPGQMTNRPSDEVWISNAIVNVAGYWQDGMDLAASYKWTQQGLGNFNASLAGTYIREYAVQSLPNGAVSKYQDGFSGTAAYPRYRTRSNLDWVSANNRWNATIGHTWVPEIDDLAWSTEYRVKSYHTFDLRVGHSFSGSSNRWLKGLQATIGMNNVFNKFPPLIRSEGNQSHDISTYDPIGRYIYGSIKYKF